MASRNCAINANEAFLVECPALRYYTPHNSSQGCGQFCLPPPFRRRCLVLQDLDLLARRDDFGGADSLGAVNDLMVADEDNWTKPKNHDSGLRPLCSTKT